MRRVCRRSLWVSLFCICSWFLITLRISIAMCRFFVIFMGRSECFGEGIVGRDSTGVTEGVFDFWLFLR